jgi:N-acetylneuraminic acid mutarotase
MATGWNGLNDRYFDFWRYDASSDSWTQMPNLDTVAARSNAVGFSIGNKGYIATGYDGFNYLRDLWEFDFDLSTWSRKADLPNLASARYEAVAFSIQNYGYVGTGYDGSNALKDFWKYDPSSDQWSSVGFAGNKRYGAVTFVYGDKGYLATGVNSGTLVSDFWVFNPAVPDSPWTKLAAISNVSTDPFDDGYTNIVRSNAAAFVITATSSGDKAYITTGENNGSLYTFTWEYDFATDRWKEKTPFERAARTGAIGFNIHNKGFVGLGRTSTGTNGVLDDLMEFHPNESLNSNDNQ